jgi:hypothetical protein
MPAGRHLFVSLAAVCFLLAPSLASGEGPGDKILVTFDAKPYSVGDLTMVRYADGLRAVERARRSYDPARHRPGHWLPEDGYWRTDDKADFLGYYHHVLNGVIVRFAAYETFVEYKRRHKEKTDKYYDASLLEKAIRKRAAIAQRGVECSKRSLSEGMTFSEFLNLRRHAFPKARIEPNEVWRTLYEGRTKGLPYYLLSEECFPILKDGKVSPWYRKYYSLAVFPLHIQAGIEREKEKYIRMLESRYGSYDYFLIRDVNESDRERLLNLINTVSDDKGTVAEGGVSKANGILRELGSPSRLEHRRGAADLIAKRWGFSLDDLVPRKFIPVGKEKKGLRSYVFVFQKEPTPHWKEYVAKPGNGLYGVGEKVLLKPVVEDVLKRLKVEKPFRKPSVQQVMDAATRSARLPKRSMGESLPKVILE